MTLSRTPKLVDPEIEAVIDVTKLELRGTRTAMDLLLKQKLESKIMTRYDQGETMHGWQFAYLDIEAQESVLQSQRLQPLTTESGERAPTETMKNHLLKNSRNLSDHMRDLIDRYMVGYERD